MVAMVRSAAVVELVVAVAAVELAAVCFVVEWAVLAESVAIVAAVAHFAAE